MGIGSFIRKFNDTECSCDEIEQLGTALPYFTEGVPAYEAYFTTHFLEEMRLAMRYDVSISGSRRFGMSTAEYDFWVSFQLFDDLTYTVPYGNTLTIACESLDEWLHLEVQGLPHYGGTVRLNPDKCNGVDMTLYDSLVVPVDTSPALPSDSTPIPVVSTSAVYLLDGTQAITYPFQAGGFTLSNVADGVADDDGATYKQVVDSVSDSLELGTYG